MRTISAYVQFKCADAHYKALKCACERDTGKKGKTIEQELGISVQIQAFHFLEYLFVCLFG